MGDGYRKESEKDKASFLIIFIIWINEYNILIATKFQFVFEYDNIFGWYLKDLRYR